MTCVFLARGALRDRRRALESGVTGMTRIWPANVAEAATGVSGKGAIILKKPGATLHEAKLLRLDRARDRVEPGGLPWLRFAAFFPQTADWNRGWATGRPAFGICRDQIAEHEGAFLE